MLLICFCNIIIMEEICMKSNYNMSKMIFKVCRNSKKILLKGCSCCASYNTFTEVLHHIFNRPLIHKFQGWLRTFLHEVEEKFLECRRHYTHWIVCYVNNHRVTMKQSQVLNLIQCKLLRETLFSF